MKFFDGWNDKRVNSRRRFFHIQPRPAVDGVVAKKVVRVRLVCFMVGDVTVADDLIVVVVDEE